MRNHLALRWGSETIPVPRVATTGATVRLVDQAMLSIRRYQPGGLVMVVVGSPPATECSTNLIGVHRLGEDDLA